MTIRSRIASDDWQTFADKLAAVLERLDEGQFLILSLKDRNLFVQAVAQGNHGLRLETTSNEYRSNDDQLSETEIARLEKMGWRLPTRPDSRPDNDLFGSPNFYLDAPQPADVSVCASLLVRTLVDVLGVADHGQLEIASDDGYGQPLYLPSLGVDGDLHAKVFDTVTEVSGQDCTVDGDGRIGPVIYGEVIVYLMVIENAIRLFCRVMEDVAESHELLVHLNALNGERADCHLYLQDGILLAMADVPTKPFVTAHLARALPEFCAFADYCVSVLNAELAEDCVVVH